MFRQALLVGFLSLVLFIFFKFYTKLGLNTHYKKHYPGECRPVGGIQFGSEDLQVTDDGLAFITSGLYTPNLPPTYKDFIARNNIRGNIFLFQLKSPQQDAYRLPIKPSKHLDPETFHPHGLSLLEDKVKGEHLIYVVNHLPDGTDRVEKFRYMPKESKLQHLRYFSDPKMYNTNDLALVGEDRFYISNFNHFTSLPLMAVENLVPLSFCVLLFVDGNTVTEVASGLTGANGVTLSKDQRFLYVAQPPDSSVRVYEIQKDNTLTLTQEVTELHTMVDNFHLTPSGDALLAGAHPIFYNILAHMDDPSRTAPSSVIRLPVLNGRIVTEEITELFYDHGDLISGSSVAAIYNNNVLIGSVINKMVICKL